MSTRVVLEPLMKYCETEVDVIFEAAREEVREELADHTTSGYGFTAEWEWGEPEDKDELELVATERLYSAIDEYPEQADKIERFCLPLPRAAGSEHAVDSVQETLLKKPQLTSYYHAYLTRFVGTNQDLVTVLESVVKSPSLVTDYQRMYLLGSLCVGESVKVATATLPFSGWTTNELPKRPGNGCRIFCETW